MIATRHLLLMLPAAGSLAPERLSGADCLVTPMWRTSPVHALRRIHVRLLLVASLLWLVAPAQAEEAPKPDWQPLRSKTVAIRGITYETETANRDWSIQTARDDTRDVTRFEVRAGDQWDEDRSS